MDMVVNALKTTIPISVFNRGGAGKVFKEVKNSGPKVVIKNNVPECVLISPEEYVKLVDDLEDAKLLALAEARTRTDQPSKELSEAEVMKRLGITQEELDDIGDVEIE